MFFRRDQINAQKEYKRKKNLKKQMRMKALDEEREADKNKWLAFNAKVDTLHFPYAVS